MSTPIQPRTTTAQVAPVVTSQAEIPVGALYGLPGFTEFTEQNDNLKDIRTQASAVVQTPFNPPASFQKTDIVLGWEQELHWTYDLTMCVGTPVVSPMGPYNLMQKPKLSLQGQYSPIECESAADMAWFQAYRPFRGRGQRNTQDLLQSNPVPPSGFANPLMPQANLASAPWPGSAAPYAFQNYPFTLEWPAGIFLDEYWDLALDGTILPNANGIAAPMPGHISPQYMAGGERVIAPEFNFAAMLSANVDQGPFALGDATFMQSDPPVHYISSTFRRVAVYASNNPAELPPVYNWQYRRMSRRITGLVGGVTQADIPLSSEYGQVLSTWVRIFDPSLGPANSGGYYNVAGITRAQLLRGSNLPRFDDSVMSMQKRFVEQHGFLPPQGTVVWDLMASRQTEKLSNARALNTLTNANTHIHLEFQQAPGPGSYAVLGTELLVPVSVQ